MEIICIIGPESSGKTTLARHIAHQKNAIYIPEYARLYTEMLLRHQRTYSYEDVCQIAMHQMKEWGELAEGVSQNRCVVMDTEWIVTQVWFEEVYGQTPNGWELPALYAAGAQKRDSNSLNPKSGAKSEYNGTLSIDSGALSIDSGAKIRFLLTAPDIEWVADPVRENGSDSRRWYLFHRYEAWLQKIGAQYEIVWHKQGI